MGRKMSRLAWLEAGHVAKGVDSVVSVDLKMEVERGADTR